MVPVETGAMPLGGPSARRSARYRPPRQA